MTLQLVDMLQTWCNTNDASLCSVCGTSQSPEKRASQCGKVYLHRKDEKDKILALYKRKHASNLLSLKTACACVHVCVEVSGT